MPEPLPGGDTVKRARKFKSEWFVLFKMVTENVGMLELTLWI